MTVERAAYFEPKTFAAGELSVVTKRILDNCFPPGTAINIAIFRTLADGTRQTLDNQPFDALSPICSLAADDLSVMIDFGEATPGFSGVIRDVRLLFRSEEDDYIKVIIEAETPEQLRSILSVLTAELELDAALPPSDRAKAEITAGGDPHASILQAVEDLAERLDMLEEKQGERRLPLSCFLSYQFEGASLEYARQVQRFLELLDVRVSTGEGYEPKPISEKVRERLQEHLDVVVLIETRGRKSMWTRDEVGRAQQPGVFLIPLVEKGATFEGGIFGDHEYIEFEPGHIGDAFLGLLEGMQYIMRVTGPR